ncbi:MAG: T9SS C-terminal target domain-containing protein [Flavobacterium sp.]|nr:MAG: T9SS C-terminal target domain-containing protein [Flavobacterium sp.]
MFDTLLGTSAPTDIEFQLSPNPVSDILTISSEVNIESVAIYSGLGQLIQQNQIDSSTVIIDVSALNSGVYVIQLASSDRTTSKKFIKQ